MMHLLQAGVHMPCRVPKSVCCMGCIRPRASVDPTQEERRGGGGGGVITGVHCVCRVTGIHMHVIWGHRVHMLCSVTGTGVPVCMHVVERRG